MKNYSLWDFHNNCSYHNKYQKKPNSIIIIDLIVFTQNTLYISSENFLQNMCLFHSTVSEFEQMFCPGRYYSKSRWHPTKNIHFLFSLFFFLGGGGGVRFAFVPFSFNQYIQVHVFHLRIAIFTKTFCHIFFYSCHNSLKGCWATAWKQGCMYMYTFKIFNK